MSIFNEKCKTEISKYKDKVMREVTEGKRGSSYPAIKRLGRRPGEQPHAQFYLPDHVENNYSPEQSAEILAQHFHTLAKNMSP